MKSTALVTGANSGIGKTIVSRLARCGYDVAINYREDANFAEHLAEEWQSRHQRLRGRWHFHGCGRNV
jgi:NAD(P)-dependent dehydrogenase (short-subunit alcohol dehydrogenase family)